MSKFFFRENKGGTENRYFPYHRHKNTSTYVTQKNIDVGSEKNIDVGFSRSNFWFKFISLSMI